MKIICTILPLAVFSLTVVGLIVEDDPDEAKLCGDFKWVIHSAIKSAIKNYLEVDYQEFAFRHCKLDEVDEKAIAHSFAYNIYNGSYTKIPKVVSGQELWYRSRDYIDFDKPVAILIVGFYPHCVVDFDIHDWTYNVAPVLAKNFDGTVLVVNWRINGLGCCSLGELTYCYFKRIAKAVAALITNISGASLENVWLIGHSTSADFAGYVAQYIQKLSNGQSVGKLIGLDPGSVLFKSIKNAYGIAPGIMPDGAKYVQVLYTDPKYYGTNTFSGLANIHINADSYCQPGCGCSDHTCAQNFAFKIFAEIIKNSSCFLVDEKPFSIHTELVAGTYKFNTTDKHPYCSA